MNSEIKAKWVSALRSGEYKQGQFKLRDENDNFCCLGVLCDLHSKETRNQWVQSEAGNFRYIGGSSEYLPTAVAKWAGININPVLPVKIGQGETVDYLMRINDVRGFTFTEIAALIEEHL